jgi:lipid-A-disaccharide synthase
LLAAKRCWQERPQLRFITAHVNERRKQEFYKLYQQYAPDLPLEFFTQRSADVMAAADVIVVGSGTATLEAMLYKKPMIIVYRMSPVTYQLARHLVKVPYIGLPNLLAQESLVPELIQKAAKPEKIAQHIFDYLDHPAKVDALRQSFTRLHKELSVNSADRAADAIVDFVGKK